MRDGKIVLAEVGVGPVTMCFGATMWERGDVFVELFEPNPIYCAELRAAIAGRPNVTLHEVALGDEPGEMELCSEGTSSSLVGVASPSSQHKGAHESETFKVRVERMSTFDKGDIDLLRVDVEGSEWFTLKHLISRPRQIVVEIYNDLATYLNPYLWEIMIWAEENGYKVGAVHESDFILIQSGSPGVRTTVAGLPTDLSIEQCEIAVRQMLAGAFMNVYYGKLHPDDLAETLHYILKFKTKAIRNLALYIQREAACGHPPERVLQWLTFFATVLKEFLWKNQNQPRVL